MILEIGMKNWRSHANTVLKLQEGTNVLVGPIGSGKSSVLDAIEFALFGSIEAVESRRLKMDDLVRRGEERAEVWVRFLSPEGEEYVVRRWLTKGKGTGAEMRKADGEMVTDGTRNVTEKVCAVLGITRDLYQRAIYSQQNRLDYILELQPSKRKEKIDELLGLLKFEEVRKHFGSLAKRLESVAREHEMKIEEFRKDRSIAMIEEMRVQLSAEGALLASKEAEMVKVEGELLEVREKCARLRDLERRISEVRGALSRLEGSLEQARNQAELLRRSLGGMAEVPEGALRSEEERVKKELGELRGLEEELRRREREIFQWKSGLMAERKARLEEIERLRREIERKREKKARLEQLRGERPDEEIGRLETELRRISEEIGRIGTIVREASRTIEELGRAGSTCPVCESPLSEERKAELAEKKRREVEEAEKRLGQMREREAEVSQRIREVRRKIEEMRAIEKEVEDLGRKEGELAAASARLAEIEAELPAVEEELARIGMEIGEVRARMEKAENRMREISKVIQDRENLKRMEEEIGRREAEREELRRRLSELEAAFDGEELSRGEKRLEDLQGQLRRLESDVSSGRERIRQLEERIKEAEERKRTIERWEREVKIRQEMAGALKALQQVLARVQVELRQEFLREVNEVMNELWTELYPYGDYTGIRLMAREGDYELQMRERGGGWVSVEGIASGGERTVACLVLRVALAILLAPKLKWIVFDEPTHNLDERSVQELARVMRERLPGIVRQILVITHDPTLEAAVSGALYRFTRDKEADGPTVCEQVTVEAYGG